MTSRRLKSKIDSARLVFVDEDNSEKVRGETVRGEKDLGHNYEIPGQCDLMHAV